MASLAKVIGLVAFFDLLTLVNLVKVVNLDGVRGGMLDMEGMEKINQMMELEARHFPHSSVTRHTSAHTRLPQKGVYGEFIVIVVTVAIITIIIVKIITIANRAILVFKNQNHL